MSNKIYFGGKGFRYIIGYKEVMLLCMILQKMSGYIKIFDKQTTCTVLIKDDELLQK